MSYPTRIYVSVVGENQGQISHGASPGVQGHEDEITVFGFGHSVIVPRDPQTGQSTGSRIHQPLRIYKAFDKTSPLLYRALVQGETLSAVEIRFFRQDPTGHQLVNYFTIKLHDAILTDITSAGGTDGHSVERDSFSVYRDSEYFRSGIIENATEFELFVHDPPRQVPISLYEYRSIYGNIVLQDILSESGAAVFYDLRAISAPVDPGGGGPGNGGGPGPGDTTAPILNLPGNIDRSTTDPAGVAVNFTVTADDNADPSPDIVCVPPSGSVFPIATTIVTCTATDNSGNSAASSFSVNVELLALTTIKDLSARPKSGKVSLLWTPVAEAVGYNVYRRTDSAALALVEQGIVTDYATFLDEGLSNGTTYHYRVRWLTADGRESGDSNEATATPAARTRR